MNKLEYNLPVEDYKWQKSYLNKVSRTFALSIDYLPTPIEEYTSVQYLLCRVPDTIEDAMHIKPEKKNELLNLYSDVIHPGKKTNATQFTKAVSEYERETDDWNLVMDLPRLVNIFRSFPAIIQSVTTPWVRELTEGMAMSVNRNKGSRGIRIKSQDDLEEYCYYVAGTVGHMIIDTLIASKDVAAEDYVSLHQNARNYGIFLQHINISKDVYDDYEDEDSVYIPENILNKYNIPQSDVTLLENKQDVTKSINEVLDITKTFIHGAEEFLEQIQDIDDESYIGWSIPYVLAVATMRELRKNVDNIVSTNPVKIEREEVMSIVSALEDGDHAAGEIRKIVEETPYHKYTEN